MHSHIYLDESGDLGWKFDRPFRNGGSSRYLTIGYIICPITHCDTPKRIVRDIYKKLKFNPKHEIKACDLKPSEREYICSEVSTLLENKPEFKIGAITVRKENVQPHIRVDANKLYNYMIRLSILEMVMGDETCKLTRDNRSIKVASGNSCIDYLQMTMWFDYNSPTRLTDNPKHSHTDGGLILVDWITNVVWSRYEDNYTQNFDIIAPHITNKRLFF